jgi:hypothetical protein
VPRGGKNRIDITGKHFGRLTVIRRAGSNKQGHVMWLCKCECKAQLHVNGVDLRRGVSQSCGCLRAELKTTRTGKHGTNFRHGMNDTPEYRAYHNARNRCANPASCDWKDYGGRGIKFLFLSFEEFFAELGKRPNDKSTSGKALYSLDRRNNDGHYEPGNVRWATESQQKKNRRAPITSH